MMMDLVWNHDNGDLFCTYVKYILVGASFLGTLVDSSRGVERARCDQESLKNKSHFYFVFLGIIDFFHQSHCLQLTWKRTPFLNLKFCPMMLVMLEGLMEKGMAMYASFKM